MQAAPMLSCKHGQLGDKRQSFSVNPAHTDFPAHPLGCRKRKLHHRPRVIIVNKYDNMTAVCEDNHIGRIVHEAGTNAAVKRKFTNVVRRCMHDLDMSFSSATFSSSDVAVAKVLPMATLLSLAARCGPRDAASPSFSDGSPPPVADSSSLFVSSGCLPIAKSKPSQPPLRSRLRQLGP
eukprot:TRINITY_DN35779_c0_g1_i1.p2 TRINITY_DN35779_c0_g1~~TRINITY_DN35779_c0_g1_i1.p2  ORF type:complete len:179 (-),score=0.79 TRINITY_DN35779_c0_g1_i1:265-801(-)